MMFKIQKKIKEIPFLPEIKRMLPLEQVIKIKFKNKNLLLQSLIHRSFLNEHPRFIVSHNERFEFLGDAVIELIVTKYLFNNFPNPEGELTVFRSSLVNAKTLSKVASEIKLDHYLFLSKGETGSTGKSKEIILADAFEALIGAIYLDQGFEVAEKFIYRVLLTQLSFIVKNQLYKDPKSELQEIAQGKLKITPSYKVIEEIGPAHAKIFTVGVFLNTEMIAIGKGQSKQEAEVDAAHNALKKGFDKK
ncbi:MAG: ribonuclease III [Patescibacteria group bacterium]|nr:ribonuclease III [Patescibacteria group bacterium]MDD5164591.1 ribonuclease III [Patescibacteria group bacterium]MDD5534346.1 ribonuclease III [Patescibacteria group bacterium]